MPLITTSFITDTDLQVFMPDVLTYGISSFATQNLHASDDVLNRLINEWWPTAISRRFGLILSTYDVNSPLMPTLNQSLLDASSLATLTSYRSLSRYILPMLASDADADGDLFSRRATRYDSFYQDEWQKVLLLPIYDFNQDGQFTNIERRGRPVKRLLRA